MSIKIYPPMQLPAEGITDTQFQIWKEELEVYFELEPKYIKFLPGGRYESWEAAEMVEGRILGTKEPDKNEELPKICRELRQFITIFAKYVHTDYYNPIIRHSTSVQWIYNKIREDYDIQLKGVHFLNILDLQWDPTAQTTPTGFYNSYRSMIIGNLAKKGDPVKWKGEFLKEDERLSPSHEDLIFLNVLQLLHPKLPGYIKQHYGHKIEAQHRLLDFKTEILTKAKLYISEIENQSSISRISLQPEAAASCNYIKTNRSFRPTQVAPHPQQRNPRSYQNNNQRNFKRNEPRRNHQMSDTFCRLCHREGHPRTVFTSYNIG